MQELEALDNHKSVYLGGFSSGAGMASYVQIMELDFALGGVIVMSGFPLPPLCQMSVEPM